MRTHRIILRLLRSALLGAGVAALTVTAGCGGASSTVPGSPGTAASTVTTTITSTDLRAGTTTVTTPTTRATTAPRGPVRPADQLHGLVAVWPFTSGAQVQTWQAGYRSTGSAAWHLDVDATALRFTRDHLGYADVDRVTSRAVTGTEARLGVGRLDPNEKAGSVAVLHLVRYGSGADAPWVVVGSDDTRLTLTAPAYGSTVGSPLAVGGRITGVDESLRVVVLGPTSATPLAVVTGIPAGGVRTSWTARLSFAAPRGTVLVVAVSTGGHLSDVESFAITAVRAA